MSFFAAAHWARPHDHRPIVDEFHDQPLPELHWHIRDPSWRNQRFPQMCPRDPTRKHRAIPSHLCRQMCLRPPVVHCICKPSPGPGVERHSWADFTATTIAGHTPATQPIRGAHREFVLAGLTNPQAIIEQVHTCTTYADALHQRRQHPRSDHHHLPHHLRHRTPTSPPRPQTHGRRPPCPPPRHLCPRCLKQLLRHTRCAIRNACQPVTQPSAHGH